MSRLKSFLKTVYNALFNFVLYSFQSINRKIRSKLPTWRMEKETLEHVHWSVKVFKWVILPISLLYVFAEFYFLGENALGSMLWGLVIFCYSNFLPDLPSIYRRKAKNVENEDFPWCKKYAFYCLRRCWFGFCFLGYV